MLGLLIVKLNTIDRLYQTAHSVFQKSAFPVGSNWSKSAKLKVICPA